VAAFAALYEQHALEIHDFLLRTVRDAAAAEDLTQMTFLRAFERRNTLSDPGKVRPWLFSIAHHLALNQLSRSRPTEDIDARYELAAPQMGPEAEVIAQESAELVWAAARSLEPRQYAVLDLATRHQMTTPEIAQALDVESSHAAVLVHRAREALGSAVQQLLVARRRTHCDRLAELVPAGVSELTPEQRASVDHHMRRCPNCQAMAARLTEPAAILGGIAIVAMPALLNETHRQALRSALLSGAHLAAPAPLPLVSPPTPAVPPAAPRAPTTPPLGAHHALRAAWIKPLAVAGVAVVVAGASVGVAKILMGGPPGLPAAPAAAASWIIVPSPGGGLLGVTCATPSDCWAVGQSSNNGDLIERDTGNGWNIVPSPSNGSGTNLQRVSCPIPDDCWAVGPGQIEHWTGGGWTNASSNSGAALWDVTCLSPSDCWITGNDVIDRLSGSGWSAATIPGANEGAQLGGLSCVSASDCWAVGNTGTGSTLIMHWNGSQWSSVPTPVTGTGAQLLGSSCVSASACWAVGDTGSGAPLIEQWNGSDWSVATSPDIRAGELYDIACASSSDCWAVGDSGSGQGSTPHALIERFSSGAWTVVPSPNAGNGSSILTGVTCPTATHCWAVGGSAETTTANTQGQSLIEELGS
jgi:RNA polymerase sigma factor (sigma-70 family)